MSTRPETRENTTFTRLNYVRPSAKSWDIIGAQSSSSYYDKVTVYPYNGHITVTNMNVRCSGIFQLTLTLMFVKLSNLR